MKPHMADDDPLLTSGEAARALGVCEKTMRNYADAGKVPYCTVGARKQWRLFLLSDIERFKRDRAATTR